VLLSALLTLMPLAGAIAIDRNPQASDRISDPAKPRREALKKAKTALIAIESSPFPYDGMVPEKDTPFLDVTSGERKGHRMPSGRVFWEDETYRERRALLHIPRGYDFTRPGVMIVFFHGHRAMLARDVRDRQLVPAQVAASGINAVVVAPQFAFNASDSSAGKFWEAGAFDRFVAEAGVKLAELHGNPGAAEGFARMPVVIVAYSGGYLAAAWCLDVGGTENRVRGVVLLDALYGELDKFEAWIANNKTTFFVSAYTDSTKSQNMAFKTMLAEHEIPVATNLIPNKWKQGVTLLATNPEVQHEDFVTQAWVEHPIKDILRRLDEYRR
jgi:pimeloyl-ACP methyl ester carboxylesterase